MNNLSDLVSFEIAKILDNKLYPEHCDYFYYAGENLQVTFDNSLTVKEFKEGELIDDGDNVHGKKYIIPQYCDIIDWLKNEFDIIIELQPVFTFALKDNIAYYYAVYKINREKAKLKPLFDEKKWKGSLSSTIKEILERLIKENYIEIK